MKKSTAIKLINSSSSGSLLMGLTEYVSDFVLTQLKQSHCLEIAEKVFYGQALSSKEVLYLGQEVSLPLIGKLIELQKYAHNGEDRDSREDRNIKTPFVYRLRPLLCLPVSQLLSSADKTAGEKLINDYIESLLSDLNFETPIFLLPDVWIGEFSTHDLLEVLITGVERIKSVTNCFLLGPSVDQLKAIFKAEGIPSNAPQEQRMFFRTLRQSGVLSIEGGFDLTLQGIALEEGFQVSIGQCLNTESLNTENLNTTQNEQEHFQLSPDVFRSLLQIDEQLGSFGEKLTWYPQGEGVLDQKLPPSGQPLGDKVLRLLALSRLVLPQVAYISAPVSSMGVKVAQTALSFGANDLGFAAVDKKTAEHLAIPALSMLREVLDEKVR